MREILLYHTPQALHPKRSLTQDADAGHSEGVHPKINPVPHTPSPGEGYREAGRKREAGRQAGSERARERGGEGGREGGREGGSRRNRILT